jgi:hypothetical protein
MEKVAKEFSALKQQNAAGQICDPKYISSLSQAHGTCHISSNALIANSGEPWQTNLLQYRIVSSPY